MMTDPLLALRDLLVRGDFQAAAAALDQLVLSTPGDARVWGLLGKCRRELRQFAEAEHALNQSLRLMPGLIASHRELALLRRDQGDLAGALAGLLPLLQHAPQDASLLWEVSVLQVVAAPAEALVTLERLRRLRPDDLEPVLATARTLLKLDRPEEALVIGEALLAGQPELPAALDVVHLSLLALGRDAPRRLQLKQRMSELAPSPEQLLEMAHEHIGLGDFAAGRESIAATLAHTPGYLPALWADFQTPAAPAPGSTAAADQFRRRWSEGLAHFESLDFHTEDNLRHVWGCVGQSTAFYRHYLDDALDEQRRYGALVARMMSAIAPGIAPRPLRASGRRIGFFGAHFWQHTVTRLFGPLIEALAGQGFEIDVFSATPPADGWAERLSAVATLHAGPRSAPEWYHRITGRELDVLVFMELGMHPLSAALAGLRMAPVQASLWGHPVSSGLPHVDYALVPDAMEPANAQDFYSERLVRLPGLGHGLKSTELPPPQAVELDAPNPSRIDLLCAQTVFKLMPEQDVVFGRILARLPNARLHLLADDREPVRQWLRTRMAPTLRRHGADPDRQLRIHGFLPLPQFLGLADACSLNLDSIGWSGGMSALDLLSQGLPTLTLEGPTMRGRQTAALLKRLEVAELVAADSDDYVERAVRLAGDAAALAELRQRIRSRRERLFASEDTLAAFIDFLREVQPPA